MVTKRNSLGTLALLLLAVGLTFFVLGAGAAETEEPEETVVEMPANALVGAGPAPDLILLQTGDVIGFLDTCGCRKNPAGGLARRAWVIDQLKTRFPNSPLLILDSGNFSDNPTPTGEIKTRALLEGMRRLGYAMVNVGERDVRMGYADFVKSTSPTPIEFLSANLVRRDTEQPVFTPHAVAEAISANGKKKVRVGVVGASRHNPMFLKDGPDGSNLVTVDPIPRVKAEVEALRKQDVRLVVLLAALHKDDARRIAEAVPGIDFILGSYGGQFTSTEEQASGAAVLYVGNQGKRMAEFRVFFDPAKGGMASHSSTVHFLTKQYPSDPKMAEFVKASTPATAETTAGASDAPQPATE